MLNEQNTHTKHRENNNLRNGWLVVVSGPLPFFRTAPYFNKPSPLYKGSRVPTMKIARELLKTIRKKEKETIKFFH